MGCNPDYPGESNVTNTIAIGFLFAITRTRAIQSVDVGVRLSS